MTRTLAKQLGDKGIRVNAVAPGPYWTPLQPSGGQPPDKLVTFGKETPTMSAGVALVVLHRLVAMASLRWPAFESLVSGDKRELVRDGHPDRREMDKALITPRDLDEAVRRKVGDEGAPIERAVLERDGRITVKTQRRPDRS